MIATVNAGGTMTPLTAPNGTFSHIFPSSGAGGNAGAGVKSPKTGAPVKGHLTIIGWIVFLMVLYWLSKSNTGYHMIYYTLVLVLIFLLVRNYTKVEAVMVQQ